MKLVAAAARGHPACQEPPSNQIVPRKTPSKFVFMAGPGKFCRSGQTDCFPKLIRQSEDAHQETEDRELGPFLTVTQIPFRLPTHGHVKRSADYVFEQPVRTPFGPGIAARERWQRTPRRPRDV